MSGKADTLAIQELQRELMGVLSRVEAPTREDVLSLTEALESLAGVEGSKGKHPPKRLNLHLRPPKPGSPS